MSGDTTTREAGARVQRCPVCDGHGYVSYPKGVAPGQSYSDSSTGNYPCHACGALGYLALAAAPRDAGREEVSDAEVEAADKSWLSDATNSLWAAIRGKKKLPSDDEVNRDRRARMKRALEAARAVRRGGAA